MPIAYFTATDGLDGYPQAAEILERTADEPHPAAIRRKKVEAGKLVARPAPLEHSQRRDLHCKDCGRDWLLAETSPNGRLESKPLLEHHLHRTVKQYADELASHTTWAESASGKTYPGTLSASCYVGSLAIALVSQVAGGIVSQSQLILTERGWEDGPGPFYESANEIVEASEETREKFLRLVDEEALVDRKMNTLMWRPRETIEDEQQDMAHREMVEISVSAMRHCIEAIRLIARALEYGDFYWHSVDSLEYAFRLLGATFGNNASTAAGFVAQSRDPRRDLGRIDLELLEDYERGISVTVQEYSKEFEGLAGELEMMLSLARGKT